MVNMVKCYSHNNHSFSFISAIKSIDMSEMGWYQVRGQKREMKRMSLLLVLVISNLKKNMLTMIDITSIIPMGFYVPGWFPDHSMMILDDDRIIQFLLNVTPQKKKSAIVSLWHDCVKINTAFEHISLHQYCMNGHQCTLPFLVCLNLNITSLPSDMMTKSR